MEVKAAVSMRLSLEDMRKKVDFEQFRAADDGCGGASNGAFNGFSLHNAIQKAYKKLTALK